MRQIYGLGAALMVAAMLEPPVRIELRKEPVQPTPKPRAPSGPVIDTTRETKREKRRRLALCIDCGQPATKPSPILNRMCQCRDDLSG